MDNPISYHVIDNGSIPPYPRFYDYILAGDGLYKRASTPHVEARILIAAACVRGLPSLGEKIMLRVPKIPAALLTETLRDARRHPDIEQMYHFHYCNDGWRVSVPSQTATPGRVSYRGGTRAVLDLHSHHKMKAFFSATDNADEQGCRFYAVIGRINTSMPQISLRLGIYGDFKKIKPNFLFSGLL